MSSITLPAHPSEAVHLRPLNILRDLPQVADLIELCFSGTMDDDGQSYLQQMRNASRDHGFLSWASKVVDSTSLPMSGFVWEEDSRILGNASLVPHHFKGGKIMLLANVATHPDYRRRGIGRALTEQALVHARQKGARELWLHVRDDNPTAIRIYSSLGFMERARRTTYFARPDPLLSPALNGISLVQPGPREWPLQRAWLDRTHPAEIGWYSHWNWKLLGPGLWSWLRRFFIELEIRQWAAVKGSELLATLAWLPTLRPYNSLWAVARPEGGADGLRCVLEEARRELSHHRRLTVEYPAGEMVDAIQAAGFNKYRTLIWMCATL